MDLGTQATGVARAGGPDPPRALRVRRVPPGAGRARGSGVRGRAGPAHRQLPPRPAGRGRAAGGRVPPPDRSHRPGRGSAQQALPARRSRVGGLPARAQLRPGRRHPRQRHRAGPVRARPPLEEAIDEAATAAGRSIGEAGSPGRPDPLHGGAGGPGLRAAARGRHGAARQLPVRRTRPHPHRAGLRSQPRVRAGGGRRARLRRAARAARARARTLLREGAREP